MNTNTPHSGSASDSSDDQVPKSSFSSSSSRPSTPSSGIPSGSDAGLQPHFSRFWEEGSWPYPDSSSSSSSGETSDKYPTEKACFCKKCDGGYGSCQTSSDQSLVSIPTGIDAEVQGLCPGEINVSPVLVPEHRSQGRSQGSGPLGFVFDHPLEWRSSFDSYVDLITITKPSGKALYYGMEMGSDIARARGMTQEYDTLVWLLNSDLSPCYSSSPYYFQWIADDGSAIRFLVSSGEPVAVITPDLEEVSAYSLRQRCKMVYEGGNLKQIWTLSDGLTDIERHYEGCTIRKYSPENVRDSGSSFEGEGIPFRSWTITTTPASYGILTIVQEQYKGVDSFRTQRFTEGDTMITKKGPGLDQVVEIRIRRLIEDKTWETITTVENAEGVASCTRLVQIETPAGWLNQSYTEGYGSADSQTIASSYTNNRVSSQFFPGGAHVSYTYDTQNRVISEVSTWAGGGSKVIQTEYADLRPNDRRPSKVTITLTDAEGRQEIFSTTEYTYDDGAMERSVHTTMKAIGCMENRSAKTVYYGSLEPDSWVRGRVKMSRDIDGIESHYSYEGTIEYRGTMKETREERINGAIVEGRSHRSINYIAPNGDILCSEEYLHTGSTWSMLSREVYEYDESHRRTKTTRANGRVSSSEWICCGPRREVDEDGIITLYSYNSAKQLIETIRSETPTRPETITSYTPDALGRALMSRVDIGSMSKTTSTAYDSLGRIIQQIDALGRSTSYSYSYVYDPSRSGSFLTQSITTPTGATLITTRHHDGNILSQTGDGQENKLHHYRVSSQGICEEISLANGDFLKEIETNGFGEKTSEAHACTHGSGKTYTLYSYNAKGELISQGVEGMAIQTYEYDLFGNRRKETLQTSPVARIIDYELFYKLQNADVYQCNNTIRYKDDGAVLISREETFISQILSYMESESRYIDYRGNTSSQDTLWDSQKGYVRNSFRQLYGVYSMRKQTIDGFITSSTDIAGHTSTQTRSYSSTGSSISITDSRGNTTTTEYDIAGRLIRNTDAAGNIISYSYDLATAQISTITNAQGKTICYLYDYRGRKVAEYGTGIQPSVYVYDEADRLIELRTYRMKDTEITTDPRSFTNYDSTFWTYHPNTGLLLKKQYPDGHSINYTYDNYNRVATMLNARGTTTSYSYDNQTGELIEISYNDGGITPNISASYNRLGQITSITDATGTRSFSYNQYGELARESFNIEGVDYQITEDYDDYGRPLTHHFTSRDFDYHAGQRYRSEDGLIHQSFVTLNGREEEAFTYSYTSNALLISGISYPNGLAKIFSYETQRDLLDYIQYQKDGHDIISRSQGSDTLARPSSRTQIRQGYSSKSDNYSYNSRNELITANLGNQIHNYSYDNIGNRINVQENGSNISYDTNPNNQYTHISPHGGSLFFSYDADGNQSNIQSSTGEWLVSYNANNRPISFTQGNTRVECNYDYMGRQYLRKVYKNGDSYPTINDRYIHRGYLRLGALDMNNGANLYQALLWDPTEPQATRPLALLNNNGTYYYGHDFNKNVTELFNANGDIVNHYDYRPYGAILESSESIPNPIQYSSEVYDPELGLISYNYRHYNPEDGRWLTRDPIQENGGLNLYGFVGNNSLMWFDYLGGKVIKELKAEYCTKKLSFFKEKSAKLEDAPYQILRGTGQPTQENIDALIKVVEEANTIVDKCGNKCYEVDIYLRAVNIQGIKALPWEGYDRAILVAHTTPGDYGNAPRKIFQISSESAKKEDRIELPNKDVSSKVDIIGCHLQVTGIAQSYGLVLVADKLKALKAKGDCSKPERIQIISGTMLVFLSCILWILTSMISLNAQTPFGEEDASDPFMKYSPKDLSFKPTDRFNDLVKRYSDILVQDNFSEFRNTRFCLDGVEASFNYFMLCGYGVAWQRPHGICSYSDPLDGSPSELCPDPKYPPSKKFKFVKVIYNASGYVYGDKVYQKEELQNLITYLVLDRFSFDNRLPYSYSIYILNNPTLQECWYFLAMLHLFAENRVIYFYAMPSKKAQEIQEESASVSCLLL